MCQLSPVVCSNKAEQLLCKDVKTVYVCVFFWRCFPQCPRNLHVYPLTLYNHMDAVIMSSDWDPDPPNILESDKVLGSKLHNHIIIISKLEAVWLTCGDGGWYYGGKFIEVLVRRADRHHDFFQHKLLVSFLPVTDWQMGRNVGEGEELVGKIWWQTLLHVWLRYFCPHISCQRQLQLLGYCCLIH